MTQRYGAVFRRATVIRSALAGAATMGVALLASCSSVRGAQEAQDDSDGETRPDTEAAPGSGAQEGRALSLSAPTLTLAPLQYRGNRVQSVTGLSVGLAPRARMLAPERVGESNAQVTYVWEGESDWAYLVVEGPAAFSSETQVADQGAADAQPSDSPQAALQAAVTERQLLVSDGVRAGDAQEIRWNEARSAAMLTWNQTTTPPGWENSVNVDAAALFLQTSVGTYTSVLYVPRGHLTSTNPGYTTLCSVTPTPEGGVPNP